MDVINGISQEADQELVVEPIAKFDCTPIYGVSQHSGANFSDYS